MLKADILRGFWRYKESKNVKELKKEATWQ